MGSRIANIMGMLLMILIILVSAPFFIPSLFGLKNYTVLTESMEPAYHKNSVVYVKKMDADQIRIGDVITFYMKEGSNTVTTHRVVAIDEAQQTFTTKGDANDANDAQSIEFSRLVGKAVYCIPGMGKLAEFVGSVPGKIIELLLFIVTIMLWITAAVFKRYESPHKDKSNIHIG